MTRSVSSICSRVCSVWALATLTIAFGLTLAMAHPAQAQCDASCAVNPPLTPSVLMVGDTLMMEAQLRANSSSSGGTEGVGAVLDCQAGAFGADETCCVAINCVPGQNCVEDQEQVFPDLFTNIQCTTIDPMVGSCTVVDDGGVQGACFTATTILPAGFSGFPGIRLIGVTADAADTVKTQSGHFGVVADIQFGALMTFDELCNPQQQGGCEGSSSAVIPATCAVEIDKRASAGLTGPVDVDDTCDEATGLCRNGSGPCTGDTADERDASCRVIQTAITGNDWPAAYDFVIRNEGDAVLDCVLIDQNLGLNQTITPLLQPGDVRVIPGPDLTCSDSTEGMNTARVECTCPEIEPEDPEGPPTTVMQSDSANLLCLEATLNVSKTCPDTDGDQASDRVDIIVVNDSDIDPGTGIGTNFINCQVVDMLDLNQPDAPNTCPGDGDPLPLLAVPIAPTPFALAAGTQQQVSGSFVELGAPACNEVTVVCNVDDGTETGSPAQNPDGSIKQVMATASAPCTPLECDVEFDKQISCDGVNFVDVAGFDDTLANATAVQCLSWNAYDAGGDVGLLPAEAANKRFVVDNTGTARIRCTIDDEVNGVTTRIDEFELDPGDDHIVPLDETCSAAISGLDTATLSCECLEGLPGAEIVFDARTVIDEAEIVCQTPNLSIDKVCVDSNGDGVADQVDVTVMNEGNAALLGCTVTDVLDRGDAELPCEDPPIDPLTLDVIPGPFPLAVDGGATGSAQIGEPLIANSCNRATVACQIDDGSGDPVPGKTITRIDEDLCGGGICPAVRLDKQVDGGIGFVDVADFDPRRVDTATSWTNTAEVRYRYVAEALEGDFDVRCTIEDDVLGTIAGPFTLTPGGAPQIFTAQGEPLTCGQELPNGNILEGENTATLSCLCLGGEDGEPIPGQTGEDTDTANLECQTPELSIVKDCGNQINDVNAITITVNNLGTADLANCVVDDGLAAAASCDQTILSIPAGQPAQISCSAVGLTQDTLNPVSVICDVVGSAGPKKVSASTDDLCEVAECSAKFDKQVSCDDLTWFDDAGADDPENATAEGCTSWGEFTGDNGTTAAEPASRRFIVTNTGEADIECTVTDVGGGTETFTRTVPAGGEPEIITLSGSCDFDGRVDDTATLACTCLNPGTPDPTGDSLEIMDSAFLECQTPSLEVVKECIDTNGDMRDDRVNITITNSGTATLANCQVDDTEIDDCDDVLGTLAPNGGTETVGCDVPVDEQETFLNSVSVTCEIAGSGETPKTISGDSADECFVPEVCETEVDKTCCIPPPPRPAGDDCQGKVVRMVFEYTGMNCEATTNGQSGAAGCSGPPPGPTVSVAVTKDADKVSVSPSSGIGIGDQVTFAATENELRSSTEFAVSGATGTQSLAVHTSCSKALGVGDQFGSMKLVLLETTDGGVRELPEDDPSGTMCAPPGFPEGTDCDDGDSDKLSEIVFEYTGEDCQHPLPNPQGGKAECIGDPDGQNGVMVIYVGSDANKFTIAPASMIDVGDTFRLTATGTDDLKASTKLQILNPNQAVAQYVEIHTSCSKPLALGDEFGALRVVGFVSGGERKEVGDPDAPLFLQQCSVPSAPPAPHCTSEPRALTFRYLGGDCNESTERQKQDNCEGSDPGAPVSITVTKEADKVSVSPSSGIAIGDTFTLSGDDKLPDVEFNGSGPGGTQFIEIHTSCSQPIDLGDRFGAFEVFAIDRKDDGIVSLGGVVEYQYTITNPQDDPLTVRMATDNRLGGLIDSDDPIVLAGGESTTLIKKGTVFEDTLNVVMVVGERGTAMCMATDMVMVSVEPPPPGPFTCDKPIDELTMIWNDDGRDIRVKAWKGDVGSTLLAEVNGVSFGDEVQVGGYAGSPNDVIWEIFDRGTSQKLGESEFHLSCSDDDMNGSEDCGKPQGNGKSDSAGRINDWLLEGMVDEGGVLDCTPATPSALSDKCGLGAELTLLLPGLMWLRRRRVRRPA